MLQAQSICKVKIKLKGISEHTTAIALTESSRVRGVNLESGLYNIRKGKSKVFINNVLQTDIILKKEQSLDVFKLVKL